MEFGTTEIIMGVIGLTSLFAAVILSIAFKHAQIAGKTEMRTLLTRTEVGLLEERLKEIEESSLAKLGEEKYAEIIDKLSKVEKTIEPIKSRSVMTSQEYLFLLGEFDRLLEKEGSERERYERDLDRRFGAFSSRFATWLSIISLLLTIAIGSLFYLVST